MYMKKIFNFALIAATVCSISFAVTSCKDDDNNSENNNGGTEQAEGTMNEAQRFWNVAGHLVSPFDMTDDYKDKTFEPTIGEPLEGSSTIRVVAADNMDVVASLYNDMTDAGISASTASHTFEDGAVGTLTYTKSTDGKSLATIDVSIQQIPHLLQIVFKTREQLGINANTTGQPYYSFGDVISRPNADGKTEYWMCVHMTFTPQNNGDSYWITLNALPQANIETYVGSNGFTYKLPKGLKTSEESMQNLAEMLYAAMEPEDWEQNAKSGNCPLPFGDVKRENVKYINRYFWERVVKGWNTTGVDEKVFGTKWSNLAIKMQSQNGGLHLLRKGYSWWFLTSNNCSLFEYTYKSGEYDKKANAHNVSNREVKQEVIKSKITVNCENEYTNEGWVNEAFFGDKQPRFIFRFATGNQLFGTTPNIYITMHGKNGIKDEYVYTKMYNIPVGSHLDMEELTEDAVSPLAEYEGDPQYQLYDVYKDEKGKLWFVVSMAGDPQEKAPISELVSFDDCFSWSSSQSTGNTYTTSELMPTRDAALRAFMLMWITWHNTMQTTEEKFNESSSASVLLLKHLIQYGHVNLRRIAHELLKVEGARSSTEVCTIAYGPGSADGQPLLRFVSESNNESKDVMFHFYEHYPSKPDETSEVYKSFSNVKILLSDLNNQSKINTYAKDFWAKRPVTSFTGGDNTSTRPLVTKPDNLATDLRNYLYNYDLWNEFGYPTDMWNEPVVVMAFDAVVDRGPNNYETTTLNGRKLTLVHALPVPASELDATEQDVLLDKKRLELVKLYSSLPNALFLDGNTIELPTWKNVWGEKLKK